MVAEYYPDLSYQVPFAADPNDPQRVDTFADVTALVRAIDRLPRGAQYELAQSRVFASRVTFRDVNEYLNPVNSASPYSPYVQPYRSFVGQAVWPKGSGGNLLNLNNWRVPADGSFESYAVGTTPEFITQAAATIAPVVTTSTPWQGTKALIYGTATGTGRQGIVYNVATVPGTQYTASAYVRQNGANTQIIRVSDQVLVNDVFNRTTVAGIGTAAAPLSIGGAWQLDGGAAGNRSTVPATTYAPGYAQVNVTPIGTSYQQTIGSSIRDVRLRARFAVPAVPTSGLFAYHLAARWIDTSNYYFCDFRVSSDATIQLRVSSFVAGAETVLDSYDLAGVYVQPGDQFYIDFQVTSTILRAAAWRVGATVVDAVDSPQVFAIDSALSAAGRVGFQVLSTVDSVSVPTYSFSAVGAVEGTSTAATGSYNRVSVTWTATEPKHEITVTTQGTAVATTITDNFNRVTVAGWGTATTGQPWAVAPTAAAFTTDGNEADIAASVADTLYTATLDGVGGTFDALVTLYPNATMSGQGVDQGMRVVNPDGSYVEMVVRWLAGGANSELFIKDASGTLATAVLGIAYTGASAFGLRVSVNAFDISAKAWDAAGAEPGPWTITALNPLEESAEADFQLSLYRFPLNTNPTLNAGFEDLTITASGIVRVDGLMHEAAATAGTFTATGSTIYPVGTTYIERWPRGYEAAGFVGISEADSVDALAALAAINLPSDYDYEVLSMSPDYYWPLSGGANSTLYPDITGNNNPPLGLNISKYGVGTLPAGGAAMGIAGAAGATGVTFTPPSPPSGNTVAATVLGLGRLSESPGTPFVVPRSLTGTGGVWRMTVAVWVRVEDNAVGQSAFYPSRQLSSTAGQSFIPLYMNIDGSFVYSNVGPTGTIHLLSSGTGLSGINPTDGELHLLVGITVQDTAGDTVIYRYIDDVLDGVNSATTASLGGPLRGQTDSLSVGATDDGSSYLAVVNGAMSKLAVWNRELDPFETARLLLAGQGWPGETSLERVERHFVTGGFHGPRRIDSRFTGPYSTFNVESGDPVTTMQAPTWSGSIDGLTDTQNTMTAELGKLWVAPDGYVSAAGREVRFLKLTPDWTLGEDTAAGEIPYGDGIEFDYDPTFVYGDVTVTRPGGATAVGGLAPDVAAAKRRFFPRSYGASVDLEDDTQAQDYADFVFYSHRAPNVRVESITVNPVANPALWHFALSVEVGQRVRVKRRAKAGNAGAGLTMSADYFVEQVIPRDINPSRGTYLVDLQLSPIGTGPGPTMQPWILEDSALSVLDSTTVLGF